MANLLEQAIEWVRPLLCEAQDDVARVLPHFAGDEQAVYQMTPEEEASLDIARGQAAHGEYATDDQMQAIWAKHGL